MLLTRDDLYSLEQYAAIRDTFRARVMAHKANRRVAMGTHATLYFEDRLTIQYQIQEMLRVERIFEPSRIQDELDAYNTLIPDGDNWKATFMLEFEEHDERQRALTLLQGVEELLWIRVAGRDKLYAVANNDRDRAAPKAQSAVHFVRFELSPPMIQSLTRGAGLAMGCDHAHYDCWVEVTPEVLVSLTADLTADLTT